jgi:hypothetical protein
MVEPLIVYAEGDNFMILAGVQRTGRCGMRCPSISLATAGEFEMSAIRGAERNHERWG